MSVFFTNIHLHRWGFLQLSNLKYQSLLLEETFLFPSDSVSLIINGLEAAYRDSHVKSTAA